MATKNRTKALRERRKASGLVPLRVTEIWCTQEQRTVLRMKIAKLIAEVLTQSPVEENTNENL